MAGLVFRRHLRRMVHLRLDWTFTRCIRLGTSFLGFALLGC
jgi:hypothetical protein